MKQTQTLIFSIFSQFSTASLYCYSKSFPLSLDNKVHTLPALKLIPNSQKALIWWIVHVIYPYLTQKTLAHIKLTEAEFISVDYIFSTRTSPMNSFWLLWFDMHFAQLTNQPLAPQKSERQRTEEQRNAFWKPGFDTSSCPL